MFIGILASDGVRVPHLGDTPGPEVANVPLLVAPLEPSRHRRHGVDQHQAVDPFYSKETVSMLKKLT